MPLKEQTAEFMAEQMRLKLSPEKTHITHVDDGFDLLGFRIKRRPWRGNKHVAYTFSSQRALREVMHRIKTLTYRSTPYLSLDQLIHALNPILRGWTNYHRHNAAQALLRVSQLLPVVASHPLATQQVPATDLETDQATMLGTQLDQPQGTRLAWPAEVPVTRYRYRGHQHPLTVGGNHRNRPSHHPAGYRRCLNPASRPTTACPVESPVRQEYARPVRRAGRGNGPAVTPAPRPGPTQRLRLTEPARCRRSAANRPNSSSRVFSAFSSRPNFASLLAKRSPEPLSVVPILESHHEVVSEPHDDNVAARAPSPPLVSPEVEHVVQIHVR